MLSGTDLLEPLGEMTESMFPGVDAASTLDEYLAVAYARGAAVNIAPADIDDYARALVYSRAWGRVATRLTATPASVSLADQGSRSWSAEQIRTATANAERWAQVATDLEPLPAAAPLRSPGTQFVHTDFTF